MHTQHRKQVKHFHEAGHLHELTFSCYRRLPLLTNDTWRMMLALSINRAIERHHFQLIAFVFMPEHVHLLVLPTQKSTSVSNLLKAIKRPFSFRIKQLLVESGSSLLDQLTIQQRPGVKTFRYWQEGPGYDRNITEPVTIEASINYIHKNPVERKLCEKSVDWKWSSARSFVFPEEPPDPDIPLITPLPPEYTFRAK